MIATLVTIVGILTLPITIIVIGLEVSYHFVKGKVMKKAKEYQDD
jgi:hypothetical protein